MPFKSEAQRRWLWMHRPEQARRWAHEYGSHVAAYKARRKKKKHKGH
jgi:hypothetical protein